VPAGLGVKIAERSDSNFHVKENIRLKQLLDEIQKTIYHVIY
jgi:hypothetical protein